MKSRILKIVSILMALVSVLSLCACEITPLFETETTTEKVIVTKTPITGERNTAIAYFNKVVNALKEEKPNAEGVIERKARGFECADELLKANLSTLADKALDKVKMGYSRDNAEQDFNEFMSVNGETWVSKLEATDVQNILWIDHNKETYRIVILLGTEENPVKGEGTYGKFYNIADKDAIMAEFEDAKNYFELKDYSTVYHDGKIVCNIDKETDQVKSISYQKYVTVTAEGKGVNNLASIGDQTITFELTEDYTYNFDYSYLNPEPETTTAK